MTPFDLALSRIDAVHAEDPNTVLVDGKPRPAELVYSERMSAMLARLVPQASEALKLAARAQHLRRWTVPRETYPMDRAGYHRWRGDLKRRQAEWASGILQECGVEADVVGRVASLVRKENLKTDAEAQALEDVACLVFLQHYAADFAAKHEREKMIGIVQKTWNKMSRDGQQAALELALDARIRSLIEEALSTPDKPARRSVALSDVAVILAAHGDRGGESPNATLFSHRAALAADGTFHSVSAGVLCGEPRLEDQVAAALAAGAQCLAVYPLFMANGYFTRQVLTPRLAAMEIPVDLHILPPLGADPRIPALMLSFALEAAVDRGLDAAATRLLVVGHGSKIGPASAEATRAVAAQIAGEARFGRVETAFLEEPEFLSEALSRDAGIPTIVIGFFSGDGLHAGEDVPDAIAESGADAIYAGSIGTSPALPQLIRSAIAAAFA